MARRDARGVQVGALRARVSARRRAGVRMLVAGCAAAGLMAVPAGAQMLTSVSLTEPGAGATVSTGRVVVEVRGLAQAQSAQARVVAGGQSRVAELSGQGIAGGSRWSGHLDLGGLPNGRAVVEGRAQLSGSSGPTDWSGHHVVLDLPAPPVALHIAPVAGRPDAVALSWPPAGVPDISSYEVQRALGGGGYEPLLTAAAGQLAHTDVGVPPGDHRYRVRAVRPGAGGAARPGPWSEGATHVAGAPGGGQPAPGEPGAPPPEAAAGVASAPPTGGISARLRAGTQNMALPELDVPSLQPLVAPRDLPGGPQVAGADELAQGGASTLSVTQEGRDPLGSDAVRLVGLGLVGLLAARARRIADRPPGWATARRWKGGVNAPPADGNEAWRGATEWSRSPGTA